MREIKRIWGKILIADSDTVWGNRCGAPYLCRMFAEKKGKDSKAEVVSCKFQNDANLVGALQCFLAAESQDMSL